MELGRTQKLEIVRMVDFGAYLGTEEEQCFFQRSRFLKEQMLVMK